MIMNIKGKLALGFMSVCVGAFALSLTSCKNSREMPVNEEQMHEVVTESYLLQEDGTLISFGSESLKATSNEKGEITGSGSYFHNDKATLTAVAKGNYKLYSFYEKNGKIKGHEKGNGTSGIVGGTKKVIEVNVTDDLSFVAIFMGADGAAREYRNLSLNGVKNNFAKTVDGKNASGSLTAVGEEYQGLKTYDGKIASWSLVNGAYKNWELKDKRGEWNSVAIANGTISYSLKDYISKEGKPRTATFTVYKDGVGGGKGDSKVVTITQNSYWNSFDQNGNTPDYFESEGKVVQLPGSYKHEFATVGGSMSLSSKNPLYGKPIYACYKVYKNGVEQKDLLVKKEVNSSYSNLSWVKRSGILFSASMNTGKATRNETCTVTWTVEGKTVGTSSISFSQNAHKYNVEGNVM